MVDEGKIEDIRKRARWGRRRPTRETAYQVPEDQLQGGGEVTLSN